MIQPAFTAGSINNLLRMAVKSSKTLAVVLLLCFISILLISFLIILQVLCASL